MHTTIKKISYPLSITFFMLMSQVFSQISSAESEKHGLGYYIDLAFKNNPEMHAMKNAVDAAGHGVQAAFDMPDPVLGIHTGMTDFSHPTKFVLSQTIPWPGTLMAQKREARSLHYQRKAEYKDAVNDLIFMIRKTWGELYETGRTIELTRQSLKLLEQAESVLLAKYSVNQAFAGDLLKLQLEMAVLEDDIRQMRTEADNIRNRFGILIDSSNLSIPFPDSIPSLSVPDDPATVVQIALEQNPEIVAYEYALEVKDALVDAAKSRYRPSLVLSADYETNKMINGVSVDDDLMAGIGISLPIWLSQKKGKLQQARSLQKVAANELKQAENELAAEARIYLNTHNDAVRRIELLDNVLIPKAEQTLSVIEEGYRNNTMSILDFLDAQRTLLDLEIEKVSRIELKEMIAGEIVICCLAEFTKNKSTHSTEAEK
ncbi:MAG: hypothetical protein GF401_09580 [Chitinivibrionales bacterium]|nr:hypothetical protein [Chitinivibrionales bacterium]